LARPPRFYLPGAYVQYLELPGTSLTDIPTDQADVAGDLQSVLKELEGRLKLLIKTAMVRISPLQEKLTPNYPEAAIRELLMNAVMHRNYNSNSPIRNSYRNPVIAEALKLLGFVNRFGYGVQRAQALLAENGNPPAEFEFDEHSVRVTIRKRRKRSD